MDAGAGLARVPRPVPADPDPGREVVDRTLGPGRSTHRSRPPGQACRLEQQRAGDDDDAGSGEVVLAEGGRRRPGRLPLLLARAAPDTGRVRDECGDQAAAAGDRSPRDPLRGRGTERRRRAALERSVGRQRLDLLRRAGPVGDASDLRLRGERSPRRPAVDQRVGAGACDKRPAGRHGRAGACGRRDRDAGALQPHPQGEARSLVRRPPLRAGGGHEADAAEHDPDPRAGRAAVSARASRSRTTRARRRA